ncbi:hypothetical protein GGD41_007130 [Paraburkholderia bryophila]|uniref:Uncharacterized protein n=1 Tax=Paraburkholderia bryophila TaxID=420952 RepID=A0A7Y9WFH5_9BURK|nr:hypothetical protein [Paraburkholderia bryophila]NYH19902.1 hypothetical protein [Paraburkholderia bryophila]
MADEIEVLDLPPQSVQVSLGRDTLSFKLPDLLARALLPLGDQLRLGGVAVQVGAQPLDLLLRLRNPTNKLIVFCLEQGATHFLLGQLRGLLRKVAKCDLSAVEFAYLQDTP